MPQIAQRRTFQLNQKYRNNWFYRLRLFSLGRSSHTNLQLNKRENYSVIGNSLQ